MALHELKILPVYFNEVSSQRKKAEVRKNDRKFESGDVLFFREYNQHIDEYTGRVYGPCRVTHVFFYEEGMKDGFVCVSFEMTQDSIHQSVTES